MVAPNPLDIIIKTPCALERIFLSVSLSTNKEPETLKKSNAIPYTIMDKTNIQTPVPGFPTPNNPKRKNQANIAINITFLIPNRFKKNGINKDRKSDE